MSAAIDELLATLGDDIVTVGEVSARYHQDWTVVPPCAPAALVRPRTTADVSTALAICDRHGQPVVTQGGLTGLAGGAVPSPGSVALSLERMTGIVELDTAAATMTVWAGTTLEAAQQAAASAGFELTYDLGARGSCTIGGNVATNAGGNRVIRYGMARDHVLGLEAVLADGTVITSLNKLLKNNAGYDLKQLFIGSEGTLGVVTRAVLRLRPAPAARTTALLVCTDFGGVLAMLDACRRHDNLTAFEVMWPGYYQMLAERRGVTPPLAIDDGRAVLVELSGSDASADEAALDGLIGAALEAGHVSDAFLASSQKDTEAIWGMRESAPMDGIVGLVHFDIGLPTATIDDFVADVSDELRAELAAITVYAFGHIGDSNLHYDVTAGTDDPAVEHRIEQVVYAAVGRAGGSISAEHGIGTLKRDYLHQSRTDAEIEVMRRVKRALDPRGILNPGKVLPAGRTRPAEPADVDAVRAVVDAAYGRFEPLIGRTPAPMLDDYERLIADGAVEVHTVDGDVVGAIVSWRDGDSWYVDNIAVAPTRHGSGIGSLLLDRVEQQARRLGVPRIWLYTNAVMTDNVRYYERRGYRQYDRRNDRGYDRIFFEKPL